MQGQGLMIEVAVGTLINTLEINRDCHAKDYAKAKKGWAKLLRKELETMLGILAEGGRLELAIKNQKPEDHTCDYDEAIEMLKFCDNHTITLDQQQYRQYVKDDWSWKRFWAASNSTYIASA